jgi:hypothetical protein
MPVEVQGCRTEDDPEGMLHFKDGNDPNLYAYCGVRVQIMTSNWLLANCCPICEAKRLTVYKEQKI